MAPVAPARNALWCSLGSHRAEAEEFARMASSPTGRQRACRKCKAEYMAAYFRTPAGRRAHREAIERYRATFPERAAAVTAVRVAIRKGHLAPPGRCAMADTFGHICEGRVEYHHHDYEKPLEVTPLCEVAHEIAHHHHEQLPEPFAYLAVA